MKLAAAFLFALVVSAVWGQLVVDTKSGLVTYVEDDVYLDGQPLKPTQSNFPRMAKHALLRAEKGRAEVLLNPCVVLHLGENSSLRKVENDATDARVELLTGSAVCVSGGRSRIPRSRCPF